MTAVTDTREQAYLDYRDKVAAYIRGKVNDHHEAEDLVSQVFVKVYQNWDSFDENKASLSTWIYTITHNTVVDYYRSRRVLAEYADHMDLEDFAAPEADDRLDLLADALMTLKERERDLIILHYYKGYKLTEVAERMEMSYINAKVIHKKALNKLREKLG
ncbi:MAG: sigma-70 family RNA polymerase sigma factor [Oscillibacter sp.]|nr:sigma-70 family RNA polymerase sigma factor [Oscillibacter sp.]MBQ2996449.1 sigma-70 family RNA polymerase sigma factor [Oscillibacter sp.]